MINPWYIVKAMPYLVQLERQFRSTQAKHLSDKMGIMIDADKILEMPKLSIPIRTNDTNGGIVAHQGLTILVSPNEYPLLSAQPGIDIYEIGNEIENPAVIDKPKSPDEYITFMLAYGGPRPISNPGLVSLNQNSSYWRQLLKKNLEHYCDYLAIHLYGQSREMERIDNAWIKKTWYRKLSDKWEWLKLIACMIEFRDKTTKPIIVTECGVCQLTAEVPQDVYWMDLVLNAVFGNRLIAATWYNFAELTEYPGKAILAYF